MTPIVAKLVAGPVSINTKAAPGEIPANMRPAATGVDAVAQPAVVRKERAHPHQARVQPGDALLLMGEGQAFYQGELLAGPPKRSDRTYQKNK